MADYCKWCLAPLPQRLPEDKARPRDYCSNSHKQLMSALNKAREATATEEEAAT